MPSLTSSRDQAEGRPSQLTATDGADDRLPESLREIMTLARTELQMEAAFIAEVAGGRRTIRVLDGDGAAFGLEVDEDIPVQGTYCQRLLEGRLPSMIPDVRNDPRARDLVAPEISSIGAWVGVPVRGADGRVYGTLCCLSRRADSALARRDLSVMRLLARLAGSHLSGPGHAAEVRRETVARIRRAIYEPNVLRIALQPVVALRSGEPIGFEALARFAMQPVQGPDVWLKEATSVGLGLDLEMAAVQAALPLLEELPEDLFLSVNVSPAGLTSPELRREILAAASGYLVLEVTEYNGVGGSATLVDGLLELRAAGVALAVDDVGAGFSSLDRILQLEPEMLKLDASLTRGIELDPRRRSLVSALTTFAEAARTDLVAEGIETSRELETLQEIGVPYGQGFYLARPESPARHLSGVGRRTAGWRR